MSFYNVLFGKNPNSEIILALLGLKEWDIERYRDCYVNGDEICVYTRTGGGNREYYPNKILTSHPDYKWDEDDDYDCTYATYHFRFPTEIKDDIPRLFDVENEGIPANLIRWINKTLFREPTENDKEHANMRKQQEIFNDLIYRGDLTEPWNGHTCVILSDDGARRVFEMFEKHGELYYGVMPYKFNVIKNDYKYSFLSKDGGIGKYRFAIVQPRDWVVDKEAAERYLSLFAEKYPFATRYFREKWCCG